MSSRCPRSGSGGIGGGDEPDRSGEPEGAIDEMAAELAADFFHQGLPAADADGGKTAEHERRIREWAATLIVGAGPIRVFGLQDIVATARRVASSKTYRDNPALVAMKVMDAAGMLIPNESGPQ